MENGASGIFEDGEKRESLIGFGIVFVIDVENERCNLTKDNCELCGQNNASGYWNCYEEFADNRNGDSWHFCDSCKSKWIAYARACGIVFDSVPHYTDGCSCHYLTKNFMLVRRRWLEFIKHKLWKVDRTPERVVFT